MGLDQYIVLWDQYTMGSDQYAAGLGQYVVGSDQYAVGLDQYVMGSDQYAVVLDQWWGPPREGVSVGSLSRRSHPVSPGVLTKCFR